MSYFRTLKYFILNSLVLLGLSISAANASIVYSVDRTIGNGSVSGFIKTDGALGELATANIIDWELTLTAPGLKGGSPDTIDFASRSLQRIVGTATTATATQLLFNFGLLDTNNYILFQGTNPENFWCLETKVCTFSSPAETIGVTSPVSRVTRSGLVAFAQVSVVPVPAAVWLFGTALIGLVGFGKRRKTV